MVKMLLCSAMIAGATAAGTGLRMKTAEPSSANAGTQPTSQSPQQRIRPVLITAPARVVIAGDRTAAVTLVGDHFDPGLIVSLTNLSHVVIFSRLSLALLTPTSVTFDPSVLDDGVYKLTVRNPSGDESNVMSLTVSHR